MAFNNVSKTIAVKEMIDEEYFSYEDNVEEIKKSVSSLNTHQLYALSRHYTVQANNLFKKLLNSEISEAMIADSEKRLNKYIRLLNYIKSIQNEKVDKEGTIVDFSNKLNMKF